MAYPGWRQRDMLAPTFRLTLMKAMGMIPFRHQAQIFAYLDCKDLGTTPTCDVDDIWQPAFPQLEVFIDGQRNWLITVPQFEDLSFMKWGEETIEPFPVFDLDENPQVDLRYFPVLDSLRPRPDVVSISSAFKGGKSVVGGIIPASMGITPGLDWDIYGLEYDICEPELGYLLDAFLSEKGLNLPKVDNLTGNELVGYIRWASVPKTGRMWLELSNGARYHCRSFRKALETKSDPLKGKEKDGFSIAEVYQFPSIQSLMSYSQNLAIRHGYYIKPSTPDRPIMDTIIERCDPENTDPLWNKWLGVSEIHRRENPYAFQVDKYFEDLKTFTREEFSVYWEGKSGRWIGAVYPEIKYFDTITHPEFWHDPEGTPTFDNFKPPPWLKRLGGADTATYYGVVSALGDDLGNVFFLHGECNYRYVTGQIEQLPEVTVESLCQEVRSFRNEIAGKWGASYADHNSQWKDEFRKNGVPLRKGQKDPELRCEITRGMAQNGFLWFAPWLKGSTLVTEFEIAKYPPKELSTRRRRRIDENDHLLDSAEHLCARFSAATRPESEKKLNPVQAFLRRAKQRTPGSGGDPLGL